MLNFSIMQADPDHVEELCEDIRLQIEQGVATMPLFMIPLTPEGDPAIDKAALFCERYQLFKNRLDQMGIPSGILIQASIGHGGRLNQPSAFQKFVGLSNGKIGNTCCPYDESFRAYIKKAANTLAKAKPAHIMLDDDFRLMFARPSKGCACPLHMDAISRYAKKAYTREEFYAALERKDADSPRLREIFIKTQIESLIDCAKQIRQGIDEADPTLPGSFCACGDGTEGAYEIASVMAGKGNPIVLRLNNANYCAKDPRDFTHILYRGACQMASLHGKPDYLLAETDTCPQNRYSTPAAKLHSHFTFSILLGATGAKHWITRLASFELSSGKAYRAKLSKYRGFYETLAQFKGKLNWVGANIPVPPRSIFPLLEGEMNAAENRGWCSHILDRFGIPMHFSTESKGVCFFDGTSPDNFTDEELKQFLSHGAVFDAPAAERVIARGLGCYLGVDVRSRAADAKNTSGEIIYPDHKCSAQPKSREIIPQNDQVKRYSDVFFLRDGKHQDILFPGVSAYQNELGGTAVVYCGDTGFNYNLGEAFGFLNESRKAQLVRILRDLNSLPVYYPEDAEFFMQAAMMPDRNMLCAILDMSLDPVEQLPLVFERPVSKIQRLLADGTWEEVGFQMDGESCRLDLTAHVFDPVILTVEF